MLLRRVSSGEVELYTSFVLKLEHSRLPFPDSRERVAAFISLAKGYVGSSARILERARELAEAGFGERDALHLAAAEYAEVDYFVTCDDRLIRRARRTRLAVKVVPLLKVPEEGIVLVRTRNLTDAEIDKLGYEALLEKIGPVGATRFIGLWLERSRDDYMKVQDRIFEGMTVDDIYAEAVRLESERKEECGEG